MGGFFEAYVDPLQELIKQKDAELEQNRAEIARLRAQLAMQE